VLSAFPEGRYQEAVVAGACGQRDVGGLDAFERDRSDVGVEAVAAQASRDDRHGLPGGDELELVLDGVDERAGDMPVDLVIEKWGWPTRLGNERATV